MRYPPRKLTEAFIAGIKPPASDRDTYPDTEVEGLELRVSAEAKSWSFVHWIKDHKRRGRETLGRWPIVSVIRAREKARITGGLVADREDPGEVRRALKAQLSVEEGFDAYLDDREAHDKKTVEEMRRTYERWLGRLPEGLERKRHGKRRTKARQGVDWSARRLGDITQIDIATLHTRIVGAGHRTTANRVLELLSGLYGFAKRQGWVSVNPAEGIKPAAEVERERFLRAHELPGFLAALDATPQPWRDLFYLLLFVGFRRGAMQAMRWEDLDLANGVWHVPRASAKNNKPTTIPLTGPALEVLVRRSRDAPKGHYVFPALSETGYITNPKKQWAALLKRAGLRDLRMHDLRRTLGSWLAMSGEGLPLIGKALGHLDPKSTAIYARLQLAPVTAAVERAQAAMLATPKNVAQLKRR